MTTTPKVTKAPKKVATTAAPRRRAASEKTATTAGRDFIQTVGRRKTSVARLRLHRAGKGSITVNGKDFKEHFPYQLWQETISSPLPQVGLAGAVDITVKVAGGGLTAQSEAIRLALSRALILQNPDWRPTLRALGYLTRDSRKKERKKPGLKRARRGPQWAKR